jgi:hypothetical protein
MIISITKIELNNYSKLIPFFKFNGGIIKELKQSTCKGFKLTSNFTLKVWYTMTLWENDKDIDNFYRSGTHFEAMKQAKLFSSKIQSNRTDSVELISWAEAKKLFVLK